LFAPNVSDRMPETFVFFQAEEFEGDNSEGRRKVLEKMERHIAAAMTRAACEFGTSDGDAASSLDAFVACVSKILPGHGVAVVVSPEKLAPAPGESMSENVFLSGNGDAESKAFSERFLGTPEPYVGETGYEPASGGDTLVFSSSDVCGVFVLVPGGESVSRALDVASTASSCLSEASRAFFRAKKREKTNIRLEALLASVPDIVFTFSPEGKFLDCLANDDAMLFMSPDIFIGRRVADVFPPTLSRLFSESFRDVRSSGRAKTVEYSLPLEEGDAWFEARISGAGDGNLFAVVRDVTERVSAKQRLEEAYESLRAADASRREFLSRIAHEIRTPLSGVVGFLDLLSDGAEANDEEKKEWTRYAKDGTKSLLSLLDDLLTASSLEDGVERVFSSETDLFDLLNDVFVSYSAVAESKKLEYRFASGELPVVVSDGPKIRRIVSNLVSNAIKFTDSGRVVVEAEFSGRPDEKKGNLSVSVCDSGPGVDEEAKKELFTPFFRGDGGAAGKTSGAGLGLSISKGLANALGGDVSLRAPEADNGARKGAVFEFSLPNLEALRYGKRTGNGSGTRGNKRSGSCKDICASSEEKVLVVDDSPMSLMLLKVFLKTLLPDTEILEAANGAEAVEIYASKRESVALVLMDVNMPVLDGVSAAAEISSIYGKTKPNIIAVTGEDSPDTVLFSSSGICATLKKPVERDVFETVVGDIAEKRGMRVERTFHGDAFLSKKRGFE